MDKYFILSIYIIFNHVFGNVSTNNAAVCNNPFYKVGEKCLHFGDLNFLEVNQSEAVEYCNDIGGNLVMIQTPTQFKNIIEYINENNYLRQYWIDGSDLEQKGKWVFHNEELVPMGTPFWYVYTNVNGWFQDPDDAGRGEDCLVMYPKPTFYLNDYPCNLFNRPLCEESSAIKGEKIIQEELIDSPTLDCTVPY
ncbi:unnamed protein product, partial [Meganyctiphanes norvegica]